MITIKHFTYSFKSVFVIIQDLLIGAKFKKIKKCYENTAIEENKLQVNFKRSWKDRETSALEQPTQERRPIPLTFPLTGHNFRKRYLAR